MSGDLPAPSDSQIVIYQSPSGTTRLEVRLQEETVWLTQGLMADLYQTTKQNISLHIQNIYSDGELTPEATVKEYLTVRQEGSRTVRRLLDHYNLDMIIAVGYRVRSRIATRFRQWATARLREYIVKGFARRPCPIDLDLVLDLDLGRRTSPPRHGGHEEDQEESLTQRQQRQQRKGSRKESASKNGGRVRAGQDPAPTELVSVEPRFLHYGTAPPSITLPLYHPITRPPSPFRAFGFCALGLFRI